jgi:hypothetical protein
VPRRDIFTLVTLFLPAIVAAYGHLSKPLQSTRARIGNRMNCKDGNQAQSA